jgi:acetyl esterase/lipase
MSAPLPTGASEVIRLWPDGPPTPIGDVGEEIAYEVPAGIAKGTTFLRNISDPTLTVFPASAAGEGSGVGVVVAPGGGWTINAWSHEGLDVARWLAAEGCTAFLLKYRVQRSNPDQAAFEARMAATDGGLAGRRPWATLPRAIADVVSTEAYLAAREAAAEDGREAIRVARAQAARFGVDPRRVGMLGFSAGAFLAVDVAVDPRDEPLAFVGAIYGGETRGTPVPADAPPLFTALAQDDVLLRIVEGVHRAWAEADRPAEHHVFARGAHGFGMVPQGMPSDRWTDLFLAWLRDLPTES